jgi:hypothetical protein
MLEMRLVSIQSLFNRQSYIRTSFLSCVVVGKRTMSSRGSIVFLVALVIELLLLCVAIITEAIPQSDRQFVRAAFVVDTFVSPIPGSINRSLCCLNNISISKNKYQPSFSSICPPTATSGLQLVGDVIEDVWLDGEGWLPSK